MNRSLPDFFAGGSLSLADLHAFPMLFYFSRTPEGLTLTGDHLQLQQWLARMRSRPSVEAACSGHD